MYSTRTGLTLGFHGCDHKVMEAVVTGVQFLKESRNRYDWLGHGIYFWESSPHRALQYANELMERGSKSKSTIDHPAVLGAVIDLGFCLDLLDYRNLSLVKSAYELLLEANGKSDIPTNRPSKHSPDLLLRDLDCAVIEMLHQLRLQAGERPFDSVRGAFQEGKELYPGAGFREKDHIQICVRNPNCVKGLFIPRREDAKHPTV
jgi:hypothetical protein